MPLIAKSPNPERSIYEYEKIEVYEIYSDKEYIFILRILVVSISNHWYNRFLRISDITGLFASLPRIPPPMPLPRCINFN